MNSHCLTRNDSGKMMTSAVSDIDDFRLVGLRYFIFFCQCNNNWLQTFRAFFQEQLTWHSYLFLLRSRNWFHLSAISRSKMERTPVNYSVSVCNWFDTYRWIIYSYVWSKRASVCGVHSQPQASAGAWKPWCDSSFWTYINTMTCNYSLCKYATL